MVHSETVEKMPKADFQTTIKQPAMPPSVFSSISLNRLEVKANGLITRGSFKTFFFSFPFDT
jgi:hypothetical protein